MSQPSLIPTSSSYPGPGPAPPSGAILGSKSIHHSWSDPHLNGTENGGGNDSTSPCNCASFLDPFPNQITWRSVSNLQHYCRVCNTQLNSCKQSRIHAEGKKHEKRLAYLKFCFENGAQSKPLNEMESLPGGAPSIAPVPPPIAPTIPQRTETTSIPPPPPPLLSQMYPSYLHYSAPPAAFYFPAQSYPPYTDFVALPPPPNTPMGMPLGSLSFGSGYYSNSSSTIPSSTSSSKPGATASTGEQLVTTTITTSKKPTAFLKGQSSSKKATDIIKKQGTTIPHSSGPPTSSGLKTSSSDHRASGHGSHHAHGGSVTSSMTSNSSHVMTCDLCSLTFPSLSVLNNHIKGSRHLRKVKSQQAYKQMKAAGMSIKQDSGEIRCEVCRVSVNSSHQLQAHLAGHKHKVRCFKRGLDPCAAMITPTSTPPSTAPSECSAPRSSVSSKYHYDPSNPTNSLGSSNRQSLLGLPPPPTSKLQINKPTVGGLVSKQPGLLGEYPGAAAVNALRGLLPLPLPKPAPTALLHKPQRSINNGIGNKPKSRKVKPGRVVKERRDSTTESDEATDNACAKKEPEPQVEKATDERSEQSSSSDKSSKSGVGNDFSSDEAKESEGDSDPAQSMCPKGENKQEVCDRTDQVTTNNKDGTEVIVENNNNNKPVIVKFSCDICNISVNSATQLSQHMNSPKHHVKAAEGQKSTEKLKEIPMLNMFLKTLQPPQNYFPSNQEKETEESSSNTEVER